MIKRSSAIEPTIGHMKTVVRLGRNPLKGAKGDALRLFYGVPDITSDSLRMKKLRLLWPQMLEWLNGHSQILGIEYADA